MAVRLMSVDEWWRRKTGMPIDNDCPKDSERLVIEPEAPYPKTDDLEGALAKLSVKAGDILLVRVGSGIGPEVWGRIKVPKDSPLRGIPIIYTRELDDLKAVDAEAMERAGWVRKEARDRWKDNQDIERLVGAAEEAAEHLHLCLAGKETKRTTPEVLLRLRAALKAME